MSAINNSTNKIYVFGEVLYDVFPDYKVLGGAPFNFNFHINAFGYDAYMISRIGNDPEGAAIKEFFQKFSLPDQYIQIDSEHETGKVKVDLSKTEPEYEIMPGQAYDYINTDSPSKIDFRTNDLLYFGTLAQRDAASHQTLKNILSNNNCTAICDLNIRAPWYSSDIIEFSLFNADILKLNEHELSLLQEQFLQSKDQDSALKELVKKYNIATIIFTKGAHGSRLIGPDYDIESQASNIKEAVNPVGAGDAFAAICCLGLLNNWNPQEILVKASAFAGEVCTLPGAIPDSIDFYNKFKKWFNHE